MANVTANTPIAVEQIGIGQTIIEPTAGNGSLQDFGNALNDVYADSRFILLMWPNGELDTGHPYITQATSGVFEDWLQLRVHVPDALVTLGYVVRAKSGDATETFRFQIASDVDGTLVTQTVSTTATTYTGTATITPGNQVLTVQVSDTSGVFDSEVYGVTLYLAGLTI